MKNERLIAGLTVPQLLQGVNEAGPQAMDYYYMTKDKFVIEVLESPDKSLLEYENGWQRKWTKKPVWVLGHGLQK